MTARTAAMAQRLTESFEELATLRTELLRRSEQQTVQLALTIAKRVIQREISLDRTILVGMAHAALDRLAECVSATIRLHPDDYAAVAASLPEHNPDGHVQVTADTTVDPRWLRRAVRFRIDGRVSSGTARRAGARDAQRRRGRPSRCRHPSMATPASTAGVSLQPYFARLEQVDPTPLAGRVVRVVGLLVESIGPRARVGDICVIAGDRGESPLPVEVVGFRDGHLLSVPLGDTAGVRPGARIVLRSSCATVPVGSALLGRVVDAFGQPLDQLGPLRGTVQAPIRRAPSNPLSRHPVSVALPTGVRVVDSLLTCGRGQRVGLFGGSGVGKSTLLGMMARGTAADVTVLALVGERGREVRTFLEHDLGAEGLARSVLVVSTSDNPPLVRMRAAYAATAIAEYFRDQGKSVLLLMDSVTRFAMAQREVGLAAGEPPTAKGYPPSVFALLPGLLERAGNVGAGSITGLYTVLVEGDDTNEPIADAVRAILDGHIVLSRDLASRNHYPAIDVLSSISRTMPDVTTPDHRRHAAQIREWLAVEREYRDLVSVGAYVAGSNPRLDEALARRDRIEALLCQPADTTCGFPDALEGLRATTA